MISIISKCYLTSYEHVKYGDTIHYCNIFATIDCDSDSSTIAQHYFPII